MKNLTKILGFAVIGLVVMTAAAFALDIPRIFEMAGGGLVFGGLAGGIGMAADAGAVPAQAPAPNVLPFRQNTRQTKQTVVGTMTYSLGGRQQITLPANGYLSKLYLRFNGTLTFSGAATAAKFAPYSIFSNINVGLNSGKQVLCDASGYQLFLLNSVNRKNGRLDQNTDSDVYVFPANGSSQTFRNTLEIPIAVSDGNNFMNGLINLQAPELQCTLTVQFASALTEIADTVTAATGSVDVVAETYMIPDPSRYQQPYVGLHKILSQTEALTGTGQNVHTVTRGGKLLRLIHILEVNGARSDAWDSHTVKLNNSQTIYDVPRWQSKHDTRRYCGYYMPTGTIVLDLARAWDQVEESDQRDILNTEQITTTQSIVTVTAGTTFGTNNNFLHTLREIYQVPS